jgi:haloalkane dehalogenase
MPPVAGRILSEAGLNMARLFLFLAPGRLFICTQIWFRCLLLAPVICQTLNMESPFTMDKNTISPEMLYIKKEISVLGKSMAYVDTGNPVDGNAEETVIFFHGNITSSYMWRNIIPHVEPMARCVAIDNIGQGDSDKLNNSGPHSYRLAEHQKYIDAVLDSLDLGNKITLVMHDWGAQLGLTWGNDHRERIKAIVYFQGVMGNFHWDFWPEPVADLMRKFRSSDGEELVLEQNFFVEKILPAMVMDNLSDEAWDEYRRPYLNAGEDRRPTLTWPREIPIEGAPADVLEVCKINNAWLKQSPLPKLLIHTEPPTVLMNHILDEVRTFPNQQEVTVQGLHYVHEDCPHEIGEAISDWYQSLT